MLAENKELRQTLINGAKEVLSKFDISYTSKLYRKVYEQL
jgi:hypothetical protein